MQRLGLLTAALLLPALLAACGMQDETSGAASTEDAPEIEAEGLPPALAGNVERANEIIDEGDGTLEAQIDRLRGHPIVVNQWASWCLPCRREFPIFAHVAATFADRVAFLGINAQDSRSGAESFLGENPVPYPHVFDPSAAQAASIGAGRSWPTTVFIDARGEVAGIFQGEYLAQDQLEAQIREALLEGAES